MNPLLNFSLTIIIEATIFCLFLRKNYLRIIGYSAVINLFTWTIANFIYGFWNHLAVIEFFVFICEAFLIIFLFNLNWKKSFLLSFIANFISAFLGLIFFKIY
jgi:hypothetical protein